MQYFSVPIEIPKKALSYDWSDVYFLAVSENEPFENAKIVSTKNAFRDLIYQQAISIVLDKYPNWGYRANKRAENFLRKTERQLLKQCDETIQESISMLDDGTIRIVVNVEDVMSDKAIDRALELFSMYKGAGAMETFGKAITFSASDFNFDCFDEDEYVC